MSVINILSPHMADLIAAGEVVERPGSVVKELVENAIDAGAKNVRVEIKGGGMALIQVSDDGCGMAPEDAGVAFLRHATSKLADERGLESISTLGFRGEALAAISAVSKIELLTRQEGTNEGTRMTLEAGEIQEMGPFGCPEGTVMRVSDLFYNTPARLKFMKSDKAEGAFCCAQALRCALGRPEISVRMLRDGEEVFFSPGDGQVKSALYALLGRETAVNMLPCAGRIDEIRVEGFVSAPHAGRGNRAFQYFFLNGRCFKSGTVQAALEQAYQNSLLTGRFPACALYITLPFGRVDVNVHPAKTEVKFSEEKKVFDAVYSAVSAALRQDRTAPQLSLGQSRKSAQPRDDFYRNMTAEQFRMQTPAASRPLARTGSGSAGYAPAPPQNGILTLHEPSQGTYLSSKCVPLHETPSSPASAALFPAASVLDEVVPAFDVAPPLAAPTAETNPEEIREAVPLIPDFRLIGETMRTYILVERGDSLLLIDKHAAHERMIFDRLKAQGGQAMSQSLLLPVTFTPGAADVELLLENSALLDELGFSLEAYGQDSVILRAVPADLEGSETALLEEICEKLSSGGDRENRRDEILHTVACKAAIKAGWDTSPEELRRIAEEVISGHVRCCPHGRPVSVELSRKELDRQFMRI